MQQVTVRKGRESAIIFLAVMAIGLSVAFYLYFIIDRYSLLYYWDAVSHLVGARKLVDWNENPGWVQIGTVWMPLPHFLLVPFSLIDPLFTTGFAGLAVSLPSLAVTSVFLFKIAKALQAPNIAIIPSYVAFSAALLYATNPNILYLGLTSMTEAPFMLFFVASAYYFLKWYQSGNNLRDLITCSVFLSLATLCRYEGWFLPVFLIIVVAISAIRNKQSQKKAFAILASLLSLSSVVFWLAWNQYNYNDPFEFANAQYYSASWQAQDRSFREILFLQPANVLSVYGVTLFTMYGPLLLGAGAIGYYIFRKSKISGKKLLLIFLALPPMFTLISLVIGIGEMSYWFNSRFMVLISPLVIIMAYLFLARLNHKVKNRLVSSAVIGALFVYQLSIPAFLPVITYQDANGGYTVKENLLAIKAGEVLKSLYDGNGNIMILAGSGLEHRVMITSGIALKNFDEIIEGSMWKSSFKEPWMYDRWIVITSNPLADAATTTKYWLDRQDELQEHYKLLYENEQYKIMVLK